jgi:hypothetical protein
MLLQFEFIQYKMNAFVDLIVIKIVFSSSFQILIINMLIVFILKQFSIEQMFSICSSYEKFVIFNS